MSKYDKASYDKLFRSFDKDDSGAVYAVCAVRWRSHTTHYLSFTHARHSSVRLLCAAFYYCLLTICYLLLATYCSLLTTHYLVGTLEYNELSKLLRQRVKVVKKDRKGPLSEAPLKGRVSGA